MFRLKLAYQSHVETVVLLINQNPRPKHTISIGIDADEYRKIKTGKNNWLGVLENCPSEKEEAIKDRLQAFQDDLRGTCSLLLAVSGKTDFATVFPDLMKDWDSEKMLD